MLEAAVSLSVSSTELGGTVHAYSGCIHEIRDSQFCHNSGLPDSSKLTARATLVIGNPQCITTLASSLFYRNRGSGDGGAMQVWSAELVT